MAALRTDAAAINDHEIHPIEDEVIVRALKNTYGEKQLFESINGKVLGVPCYQLLGGASRNLKRSNRYKYEMFVTGVGEIPNTPVKLNLNPTNGRSRFTGY